MKDERKDKKKANEKDKENHKVLDSNQFQFPDVYIYIRAEQQTHSLPHSTRWTVTKPHKEYKRQILP